MASFLRKVRCVSKTLGGSGSSSDSAAFRALFLLPTSSSSSRSYAAKAASSKQGRAVANEVEAVVPAEDEDVVPTSGISRPLSEILKQLNKKVPDSLIRVRTEADGFTVKYIPWHLVNRILNLHAPEWSGEVRSITYSADGKSVSVVYRVTLYGTDAEIYRESTGTASVNEGTGYGDPVQKAEAMAFRRACARLGLGLHLYHEDML
ncbi:DNA repair RAD52-like protein 1, mitochondrial [Rhododendron vialii]|uniref:DNA repair RAD52-like protein 1, mitochondrial n=1 Tax=Rhododendron vialii TaxID=182163 RepID=UPI00265F4F9D|nr:DNA repair RAD52-like protein 1, mitochondrial [Rhododendron vialii]